MGLTDFFMKLSDGSTITDPNEGLGLLCYQTGIDAFNKGDFIKAEEDLQTSCSYGYIKAYCALGAVYKNGGNGVSKDMEKAAALYQKACNLGDTNAYHNLGTLYLTGNGVYQDEMQARHLFMKACENNHPASCFNLGSMYLQGAGGNQDIEKGIELYKKARNLGHTKATEVLIKFEQEGYI